MPTTILNRSMLSSFGDGDAAITLDATESENHEAEVEVTDHPVEKGADITDHARLKPRVVTITGIISDTPVNDTARRRQVKSEGVSIETSSLEDAATGAASYSQLALDKLEALRVARQLVSVVTSRRVYKNMILMSVKSPVDAKTGDAVRVTVAFKEIRQAVLQRQNTTIARTATKKKLGAVPAPKTEPERAESFGHRLLGGKTGSERSQFIDDKLSPEALVPNATDIRLGP